jgi:hypothetical protein
MRNVYKIFVKKSEGGSLGRPRCRWDDNIKMDLKEIGCENVNWIYLAQDRDQCCLPALLWTL